MADVHTKEVRSYNMSQIRSKNTKPELVIRKYLFAKGKGVNILIAVFEPWLNIVTNFILLLFYF